jgi:hypothetical protein
MVRGVVERGGDHRAGAAGEALSFGSAEVADERETRLAALLRAWWQDERPAWTEIDWWDAPVRNEVRSLLWLRAGPRLAAALAAIDHSARCPEPHTGESPPGRPEPGHATGWPCACMVVLAAAWEACAAWAAAGAAVALVDAVGPEPAVIDVPATRQQVTDPAREELAHALRMSPTSMGNRISAARGLVCHPQLVELVESAAISPWAARLVVLEVTDLSAAQAAEVADRVCRRVRERLSSGRRAWTSAEVGRAARMARRRLCPDTDRKARQRAFTRRRVQVFPDSNGMSSLVAHLDEADAHRIHRRLSALARGLKDETDARTCDQFRADVLVDLLLGVPQQQPGSLGAPTADDPADMAPTERSGQRGSQSGRTPAAGPPRPEIQVIVSLETLLGMVEDPAEIPGLGPIPAQTARHLAADGRWRAWVADATGAIAATGSRGYVPSVAVARAVRAREPQCRMPGCRHASERCDLDHTVPFPTGATTSANLGPLCRRHHVLKTHVGWLLEPVEHADQGSPPGPYAPPAWRWRTPAGFTVTDHPTKPLE